MEIHAIPNYEARKAALIEEIIAAFDGVSRKGGVSLSEAEVIDDYGDAGERYMARQQDKDTRWEEVTIEELSGNWPSIFLDAIGFRYYMPVFSLYSLHQADVDYSGDAAKHNRDLLIFQLSARCDEGEIEKYFLDNFEIFTLAQSQATAHFLQLETEREDVWRTEHLAQLKANIEFSDEEWKANFESEELAGISPEELDEWKELEKRDREDEFFCAQQDSSYNKARYALEKYWGRFL